MARIVFYLDDIKDTDLLSWWDALEKGERSAIIRDTLRAGLRASAGAAVDLASIRAVVESAVKDSLSGLAVAASQPQQDTDPETTDLLNDLNQNLLLE